MNETPQETILSRALFYLDDKNYTEVRKILVDALSDIHADAIRKEDKYPADQPTWMNQPRFTAPS